jgi:hypothetical protein
MNTHRTGAQLVTVTAMVFVVWTGFADVADAATRTVCYRVKLADDREECSRSSETGARRPCKPGSYVDAVGHTIELWDKDSGDSSNDEFIRTVVIAGTGRRCFTFEWEDAPYSGTERHPDVYLRYINRVRNVKSSPKHRIRAADVNGDDHVHTTWRNGTSSDPDLFVAKNCKPGRTCQIYPGIMWPTSDTSSERALWIMALDSAQHALQVFGTIMDTDIEMRYPDDTNVGPDGEVHSYAASRDLIGIRTVRGKNGFTVAHEVGHVVQMQEFDLDAADYQDGHLPTIQGWANYVALVSWYDPDNSGSRPNLYIDWEAPNPCNDSSTNAESHQAIAKAFWDLNDRNNEAGVGLALGDDDKLRFKSTRIAKGWRRFPDGTGNRGRQEPNGVNMRDYYANNLGRFGSSDDDFLETLIDHNCLEDQTDG